MQTNDMKEKTRFIAIHYGQPHQLLKLREEAAELVEAIDEAKGKLSKHVIEEMADVSVVMNQFILQLFDHRDRCTFSHIRIQKINRTISRIKKEISAADLERDHVGAPGDTQ